MSPPASYYFGGLKVRSSFALQGLRPFCAQTDKSDAAIGLVLGDGPPPEGGPQLFRWPGRYGMSLWSRGRDRLLTSDRNGTFLVADQGSKIVCFPDARFDPAGAGELFVRRILPRLAQLHGGIPLHAASLSDGKGIYLLLGPSGAGKSTLSATLNRELGWKVFGDDVSILHGEARPPVASPGAMGVCLWQDSLSGLDELSTRPHKLTIYENKFWCGIEDEQTLLPQPVAAFLMLVSPRDSGRRLAKAEITPIPPRDALLQLMHQLIRFDPTDQAAEARSFKSLSGLTTVIPTYAISYPRQYDHLPMVARLMQGVSLNAASRWLP